MSSDRLVTAGHVLKAVMELDRRGATPTMSEWERLEPDLMEYVLESLTTFYHRLLHAGLSESTARKLHAQARANLLVALTALRRAQREAWDDGDQGAQGDSVPRPPPPDPAAPSP